MEFPRRSQSPLVSATHPSRSIKKERKGLFALRPYIAFPTNATYRLRAGGSLTTKIHDNASPAEPVGRSGEIRTRTEQILNLLSLPLDYTPIKMAAIYVRMGSHSTRA